MTVKKAIAEDLARRRAAARALFEGQPGATLDTVAAEVGVEVKMVRAWKGAGKWSPAPKAMPNLSARAGQLADAFKVRMSQLGKPLTDEVAAAEAAREASEEFAVDVRAEVLSRHRKEWAAPRKVAYEALQQAGKGDVAGGFERAKLAKITAETLTLVQVGECRAYGLNHDARSADDRTVVVVERGAAAPAVATGTDDGGEF
jgi:AcrR family transcriptional regulator